MPTVHRITSLDLPDLQPYRTLRRPQAHLDQGIFVAEGEKVVRRLLASSLSVVSLLLTVDWLNQMEAETKDLVADLYVAEKDLLETIVGFRMHQGIMAVACVPREPSLDDLVRSSNPPRLFVAIDGLVFAENVGVVVRNCAAFGVQGILVGATSASPYLRRAVRNSMGTVFQIHVIHSKSLSDSLKDLRTKHGTSVIIADAHTDASLYAQNLTKDVCLVFGNEDAGVSPEVESNATAMVRIPMKTGVDSLNVASASAVILGEVSRQRSLPGPSNNPNPH